EQSPEGCRLVEQGDAGNHRTEGADRAPHRVGGAHRDGTLAAHCLEQQEHADHHADRKGAQPQRQGFAAGLLGLAEADGKAGLEQTTDDQHDPVDAHVLPLCGWKVSPANYPKAGELGTEEGRPALTGAVTAATMWILSFRIEDLALAPSASRLNVYRQPGFMPFVIARLLAVFAMQI